MIGVSFSFFWHDDKNDDLKDDGKRDLTTIGRKRKAEKNFSLQCFFRSHSKGQKLTWPPPVSFLCLFSPPIFTALVYHYRVSTFSTVLQFCPPFVYVSPLDLVITSIVLVNWQCRAFSPYQVILTTTSSLLTSFFPAPPVSPPHPSLPTAKWPTHQSYRSFWCAFYIQFYGFSSSLSFFIFSLSIYLPHILLLLHIFSFSSRKNDANIDLSLSVFLSIS